MVCWEPCFLSCQLCYRHSLRHDSVSVAEYGVVGSFFSKKREEKYFLKLESSFFCSAPSITASHFFSLALVSLVYYWCLTHAPHSFPTDFDSMSLMEGSDRGSRQGQRRKQHRWSGPDHFFHDSRLVRLPKKKRQVKNKIKLAKQITWLFFLFLSGFISLVIMTITRLLVFLLIPSSLMASSQSINQCWMNSLWSTWHRTAACWGINFSGSKRFFRLATNLPTTLKMYLFSNWKISVCLCCRSVETK